MGDPRSCLLAAGAAFFELASLMVEGVGVPDELTLAKARPATGVGSVGRDCVGRRPLGEGPASQMQADASVVRKGQWQAHDDTSPSEGRPSKPRAFDDKGSSRSPVVGARTASTISQRVLAILDPLGSF